MTKLSTFWSNLSFWVLTGGLTQARLLVLYKELSALYYRDYQSFNLTSGQRLWIRTMKGGPELFVWDQRFFLRLDRFNQRVYCEKEDTAGHEGFLNLELTDPRAYQLALALRSLSKFNPMVPSQEGVVNVG